MKILSIIWGFCGGGVDKVVMTYTKLQQFPEIDIDTVCIHGKNWKTKHGAMAKYNMQSIVFRNRLDLSWVAKTAKLIKEKNPDLVFVHGFNGPVVAMLCRFYLKDKFLFVCSYHGPYHAPKLSRLPLKPIFNSLLHYIYRKHAFGIVSVAEHSRRFLISSKVPAEKIITIHNGLSERPEHNNAPTRKECGFNEEHLIIGLASRLDPFKGIKYLIEAMPKILEKYPKTRFLIIGRGTSEDKLKDQCTRLGVIDKVCFAGYQDNVDAWLDLLDVFVLPSLAECHSIGLLEAMRAGQAIVATNVGGNPESVENERQALLVDPADSKALGNALIRLIEDGPLRKQLAAAAQKRFEAEFTEDFMLKKTADWLSVFHS